MSPSISETTSIKKFQNIENQLEALHHGYSFYTVNITQSLGEVVSGVRSGSVQCYVKQGEPITFHVSNQYLQQLVTDAVSC